MAQQIIMVDILPSKIKGINVTFIDWCIDIDDDDWYDVEDIEASLPKEKYFPFESNIISDIQEKINGIADELLDQYGFLVNGFNYELIGENGKQYEPWPKN